MPKEKSFKTVAKALLPKKLPNVVFYVERNNHIRKLTDLVIDERRTTCSCITFSGKEKIVDDSSDGANFNHTNVIEAEASVCFTKLADAVEFIAHRQLVKSRDDLERDFFAHYIGKLAKISRLKKYPEACFEVLADMELLNAEQTEVSKLVGANFKEIAESLEVYRAVVDKILKKAFPTLTEDDQVIED